jgi:hypothetical protein
MGDQGVKIGRVEGMVRVGGGVVVMKSSGGKNNAVCGDEEPEIGSER